MGKLQLHRKQNTILSKKLTAIAVAVISINSATSYADDLDKSMFSFKGFGTLGVVHSSEDQADFVGSPFQPNGAGRTQDWGSGVDSNFGAQVNANFSDKFSAVVQAVAQHQYDNSYRPLIEWANIKYQATSELSVRLGRIVLPGAMYSETRYVGYANPWIRPPEEIYFLSSITNSDGGDISYRSQIGDTTNTVQAFYGNSTIKLANSGNAEAKPTWGFNDIVEFDALTLRAAYVSYKVDLNLRGDINKIFAGLDQFGAAATAFGYTEAGAQSYALADKYSLKGININLYTVGVNYDPGDWFAMGEFAHYVGDALIADSNAGYVTAGYRIDKFTPYATYSEVKADRTTTDGISTAGLPTAFADGADALTAGLNATLAGFLSSQRSVSIGVRWDFMPSVDLKVQYDRINMLDDTKGKFTNASPSFQPGGDADVFSAAIDFVF